MTALFSSRSTLPLATAILLALALAACDSAVPDVAESALSADAKPAVLSIPDEDPGPPYYANFFADFIPTEGGMVGITFVRDPDCIPATFNLLTWMNPPAAFGCDLTVEGRVWYEGVPAPGDIPYKVELSGSGVPVYFVDRAELDVAMADNVLTIGELQGLNSLLIGAADRYRQVTHNSNHGSRPGHEVLNTSGTLEDGRHFQFRYNERFDPETGVRTFWAVRISFQ